MIGFVSGSGVCLLCWLRLAHQHHHYHFHGWLWKVLSCVALCIIVDRSRHGVCCPILFCMQLLTISWHKFARNVYASQIESHIELNPYYRILILTLERIIIGIILTRWFIDNILALTFPPTVLKPFFTLWTILCSDYVFMLSCPVRSHYFATVFFPFFYSRCLSQRYVLLIVFWFL